MTGLWTLIKRNTKLYFKDKGMFFSSMITPVILLVLYVTFLKKVYDDSFRSALAAAGASVPEGVLNGCVGGQLASSLLAVICVTVAFCSNLLMIRDKSSGARHDLTIAPVRPGVLGLGYCLAALLSTLVVGFTGLAACLSYLAVTGWYLSAADVALSSCVNFFLTTDGQASAVGTVVSAGYGFVCGAYMPISSFGPGLQRAFSFLPGTYGTGLLRNHALRGVFAQMRALGFSDAVMDAIGDSVDCNLYFYGARVHTGAMYAVLCGSILLLMAAYLLMNHLAARKNG